MKIVVPAVRAGLCLVRIPLGVAVLSSAWRNSRCRPRYVRLRPSSLSFRPWRVSRPGCPRRRSSRQSPCCIGSRRSTNSCPWPCRRRSGIPLLAAGFHRRRLGRSGQSCQDKNRKGAGEHHQGGPGFHGFLLAGWRLSNRSPLLARCIGLVAAADLLSRGQLYAADRNAPRHLIVAVSQLRGLAAAVATMSQLSIGPPRPDSKRPATAGATPTPRRSSLCDQKLMVLMVGQREKPCSDVALPSAARRSGCEAL